LLAHGAGLKAWREGSGMIRVYKDRGTRTLCRSLPAGLVPCVLCFGFFALAPFCNISNVPSWGGERGCLYTRGDTHMGIKVSNLKCLGIKWGTIKKGRGPRQRPAQPAVNSGEHSTAGVIRPHVKQRLQWPLPFG